MLDLDVTWEGQKAARKLAREAVLRGIPVHIMEDGAYGGYSEPSDQWEAEGALDLFERSRHASREILATHYPNYFSAQADTLIREKFPIRISSDDMHPDSRRWSA